MCAYQTTMSVYIPHMNSLPFKMWPGAMLYIHFTFLEHGPKHMPATLHIYVAVHFYCSPNKYRPHITAHIHQKSILPYYCKMCTSKKYYTQLSYIFHMPKLLDDISGRSMPAYKTQMSSLALTMWQVALYTNGNNHNGNAGHQWCLIYDAWYTYTELATLPNQPKPYAGEAFIWH